MDAYSAGPLAVASPASAAERQLALPPLRWNCSSMTLPKVLVPLTW